MQQFKRRYQRQITLSKRLILILLIFLVVWFFWLAYRQLTYWDITQTVILDLLQTTNQTLKTGKDRVNVLLLGRSGIYKEGGDLTDTLILASVATKEPFDIKLLSIPRDIWVPTLADKINSSFHYGEEKVLGGGMVLSKATVEEVVGVPVHYAVLVDFDGFVQLIDAISGIEVMVKDSFTDDLYPISGKEEDLCDGDKTYSCRFETVIFTKGVEVMNGERALKYVRSRHAEDSNGNDYSRGKRQQAVLSALKNKLLSRDVVFNKDRLIKVVKLIKHSLQTDLTMGEVMVFANLALKGSKDLTSFALTEDVPEIDQPGLLINPPLWQYDGRWVLSPKHGDFSQIHKYIECIFTTSDCEKLLE